MDPSLDEPKQPLTRHRILVEAIAVADEHGVDALSMRKLAERLGAGAMSLYTHVRNKDDLIEGMVDLVVADIEPPVSSNDWRAAMRASARSAHAVLLEHPWAAPLWTNRMPGPARFRYMEALLEVLTEAELPADLVYRGYHAITMHIVGFTIQELGYLAADMGEDVDVDALVSDFEAGMGDEAFPHLATHVRAHMSGDDHGDEFLFVLDLILDGLERHRP